MLISAFKPIHLKHLYSYFVKSEHDGKFLLIFLNSASSNKVIRGVIFLANQFFFSSCTAVSSAVSEDVCSVFVDLIFSSGREDVRHRSGEVHHH